jgi:UDP-GlcNAc:undecaprenyl-phosphate GlcNAc-1-phosphate transferase
MGGVAMLVGFGVAILVASRTPFLHNIFSVDGGGSPWGVLAGGTIVCAVGVADDLWELDAVTKLAGQSIAAGVMAWKGVQLVSIPLIGETVLPSSTALIVLSIFVVVLTINAVNFVDGLDGLAAGVVGIGAAAFFVYSYFLSHWQPNQDAPDYKSLASLIAAALVGTCIGFLPHNFNPARVFMGDSGSMLIGLLLASTTLSITGQVDPTQVSEAQGLPIYLPVILPFAVLALPLIDLLLAVLRRTRAGKAPWHPDKQHLHHRMLALGHGHRRAVLVLYAWTAIVAFGVASTIFIGIRQAIAVTTLATVVAAVVTWDPLRRQLLRQSGQRRRATDLAPAVDGVEEGAPSAVRSDSPRLLDAALAHGDAAPVHWT